MSKHAPSNPAWSSQAQIAARIAAAWILLHSLAGCTLIGAGIGASVSDRDVTKLRGDQYVKLRRGDEVWVSFKEPKTGFENVVHGKYVGAIDGRLRVKDYEVTEIELSRIESIQVRSGGSYWLAGGAIGAAVDVTLIVICSASGCLLPKASTEH